MSTQSVVDEIKLKAPAWARDGSSAILQKMDQCQRFMFSKACLPTVYIDPSTGKHPVLATTAGTFEYELPDVSKSLWDAAAQAYVSRTIKISKALEVYIPNGNIDEYSALMLDPMRPGSNSMVETRNGRIIIAVTTVPATQASPAKVIFENDPGTYADRYRVLELIEPLRLTEDTIPLMIEERWEPDLIEGVLALIERADYGRSDRWNYFLNDACQRFWYENSLGQHTGQVRATPPRYL